MTDVRAPNYKGELVDMSLEAYLTPTEGNYHYTELPQAAMNLAQKNARAIGIILAHLVDSNQIPLKVAEDAASSYGGKIL